MGARFLGIEEGNLRHRRTAAHFLAGHLETGSNGAGFRLQVNQGQGLPEPMGPGRRVHHANLCTIQQEFLATCQGVAVIGDDACGEEAFLAFQLKVLFGVTDLTFSV